MKVLNKFTDDYFKKYNREPVTLKSYSLDMSVLANKYIILVKKATKGISVEVKTIGSVAYQIPTADVEIAVYVKEKDWKEALGLLEKRFKKPVYSEKEFALFPIGGEKYDFDIHVYTGYEGLVSRKLTKHMLENPELIEKYSEIKSKYAYSKREYQYRKHKFMEDVIRKIPS